MRVLTIVFIFFAGFAVAGNTNYERSKVYSSRMTIDPADTVIFDLGHATVTSTYIDIPVSFKSDDVVNALDFAFKFDESKLTYDSIINFKSYMLSLANFNLIDRFLRFTSSSLVPIENNTKLVAIRFNLAAPCVTITSADFNSITVYLNGDPCSYKINGSADFKPVANFASNNFCSNTVVHFNDISSVASGDSITSRVWNFGNDSTSTLKHPSTTYTTTGGYDISLIVTSGMGCKDTVNRHIIVNPSPTAGFTSVFNCSIDSVLFTNTSSIPSGTIIGWNWNFGDGSNSSLHNPSHNYALAGSFPVTLTITSDSGCSSTFSNTVFLDKPVANFGSSGGCAETLISFTDSTTISTGTITNWNWDFGDGHNSALQNPSNTFTTSGSYTVSLTVTSSLGCVNTISKTVVVNGTPLVHFGADQLSGCGPLSVNFADSTVAATGATYLWNFGDGSFSSDQNPAHSYSLGGDYSVKLTVTNPGGCSDSLTKLSYIHVSPSPVVNFSPMAGCVGTLIHFTDASTISSGSITGWNWNFGDGTISILKNPLQTYGAPGAYNVSLVVTSDLGCSGTIVNTVTIDSMPVVHIGADNLSGCSPLTVNFSDLSGAFTGATYRWSFGDGSSSTLKDPTHIYVSGGDYTVKHYVTTAGGCDDSLVSVNYIHVNNSPVASFSFAPSVVTIFNANVTFNNLSSGYTLSSWTFGDSAVSSLTSPSHTFADTGRYVVCLTVQNALGCSDSYCNDVGVIGSTPVAVPSAFSPNGDNANDILKVRGGPIMEMEFRVFNEWGNLLFSSNSQDEGWDGTYKGIQQPSGIYEYTLTGKTADNKSINIYNVVNLVR